MCLHWNINECGQVGGPHADMRHMFDPDEGSNVKCVRPGCGHTLEIHCLCRIEVDMTKYIGCPTHTVNPRVMMPPRGPWGPHSEFTRACWPWLPESMGGDLTLEEADRRARELIHRSR